jgi:hypothetical protein
LGQQAATILLAVAAQIEASHVRLLSLYSRKARIARVGLLPEMRKELKLRIHY